MQFSLTDEQTLLRDSAAAFVRDHSSLRRIRALRDGNDADGFSRDLWKDIAGLGWLGIPFAEDDGGLGLGLKELALVLEEFGKGLMPEPLLSSILLGGGAIQRGGSAAQRAAVLPALIGGELLLALAYQERQSRYDLQCVATRAERAGDGWRLRGEKCLVLDGHVADRLIVSARTAGGERERDGITLFLLERGAPGVSVTRQSTLDGRNAALVRLDGVAVGPADAVGAVDGGGALLAEVIDRATAGLCAEMLGGMETAFAMTLDYLKTRQQFGAPIGSFQALKHRAAVLFTEIELARSAVLAAAMALDEGHAQAAQFVSAAKARCSDTFVLAGNEGVQMHGGIGMTDEHDIGFFLKRARAAEITFGDAAFHRDRFAALQGYNRIFETEAHRVPSVVRRDWLIVLACLGCQIGMGTGGYVFPVFLIPVTEELGWSRTTYALANPIMSTSVALIGPLVGWLSDRRGPRAVLVAGSLLMSASLMAAGRMQTPTQFYVIALGIGIAVACLGDLPTGAAIAGRFRERRGVALGLVYIGSNIGGALVPLVGMALATGASWRTALTGIGGALWIMLLPLALSVNAPPARAADDGESADGFSWRDAVRQRDFWLLFWVLFAFYLYRLGLNTHLVAFLRDLGYSSLEAAGSFSLTLAIGILGKLLAGAAADRLGARPAVLANFTLIAIASLLLLFPSVRGALPAFLVLHGFATAAEDVVIPLIIAQRFGSEHLGRIYGLLLLALVPGGILGPIVAGRVYDLYESYTPVFTAFAIANVTAVAALALVRRSPRRAQRSL